MGDEAPNPLEKYLKLISAEGHEFIIEKEVSRCSGFLRRILESKGAWEENTEPMAKVHLQKITTSVLEHVIQYMYYKKANDNVDGAVPPFDIQKDKVVPLLLA